MRAKFFTRYAGAHNRRCEFLRDVPALESAGVVVRMPASWRMNRPARPQVKATVGGNAPSHLGMDALLDFRMEVTLDGENLTAAEIKRLLAHSDGLALIRGKWVEVDHERLSRTLEQFEVIERRAVTDGLSFGEAMRMLAGAGLAGDGDAGQADVAWSETVAGPWLAETLAALRHPDRLSRVDPGRSLQGTLRPYQRAGVAMALSARTAKTWGVPRRRHGAWQDHPGVVAAAGVEERGRGEAEALPARGAGFAARQLDGGNCPICAKPSGRCRPSISGVRPRSSTTEGADNLADVDLVITSYGFLTRLPWLGATAWRLAVLDEAQAIKNPAAKQTRTVKQLRAETRVALTGTPIENRLGDLWSIFDFINPGLLGSSKEFSSFVKRLGDRPQNPYGPLRDLVRPYILRRLKTDKSIIADLPDKTEVKTFCPLSRKQAALYQQAVDDLAGQLEDVDGMKRRGIVLAFLMRLKQICNHPSQWLGDGAWAEQDSGKLARLRDIAEVVSARQEKALVFTQFKETTAPLAAFLASVFGQGRSRPARRD